MGRLVPFPPSLPAGSLYGFLFEPSFQDAFVGPGEAPNSRWVAGVRDEENTRVDGLAGKEEIEDNVLLLALDVGRILIPGPTAPNWRAPNLGSLGN